MFLNQFPEVISFNDGENDVEAFVMLISTKYTHESESGVEAFVALCYDKDNQIYEVFLNECKIVKVRNERKNWNHRRTFKTRAGKRRESDIGGNIYPADKEGNTDNGNGSPSGEGEAR